MKTRFGFALVLWFAWMNACACQPPGVNPDGGSQVDDGGTGGGGGGVGGGATGGGAQTGGGSQSTGCGLNSASCNGVCVITATDPANCGGCGQTCAAPNVCVSGVCGAPTSCPMGTSACSQRCVDIKTDSAHCGACGTSCPSGQGCVNAQCVPAVVLPGTPPACVNGGPPVVVATDGGTACTGTVAQITFRWALCSCSQLGVNGALQADRFNSATGQAADGGGSVGVNGSFSASQFMRVGTFWSSATRGLNMPGSPQAPSSISYELHANAGVTGPTGFSVGSNAWVNGNLTGAVGAITIGGTLYVPTSASVSSNVTASATVRGPVVVPQACDCSASQLLDIAGYVRDAKTHNDNAMVGLASNVFAFGTTGKQRLDLPCGRYYLDELMSNGDVTIAVHGRAALFIGGDVRPNGALQIVVDPQATLDVFIDGEFTVNSPAILGSTLFPRQTRFYISGTTVAVNGASLMAGNFYFPRATFISNGDVDAWGSIFAGSYTSNGDSRLHYDSAILSAAGECNGGSDGGVIPTSPDGGATACQTCRDCANQSCVNGTCGACTTSADCCSPLTCRNGVCEEQIN